MNKNTKKARELGYSSMKDMNAGTNKVYSGSKCNTKWDAPESKHRKPKSY